MWTAATSLNLQLILGMRTESPARRSIAKLQKNDFLSADHFLTAILKDSTSVEVPVMTIKLKVCAQHKGKVLKNRFFLH